MKQSNIAIPLPEDPVCTFGAPADPCVAAWQNRTGPYTRPGSNTNAFLLKSNHSPDGELDLLLFAIPFPFRGYWRADANVTIPPDPPTVFGISMVHIKAQNRAGVLKLRSDNPRDTPDINFHFFHEEAEADLGAMADAVAWGRRVYGNVAAPYGPVEPTEPPVVGGPEEQAAADYQWIKDQAFGHHASGTCGIGADDDELAVLDSKFRVRGVDGLRVVDGSVFPRPPGAFPVVPTYLISEKASRDILGSA
jgi:choline dehydrogenase